MHLNSRKSFFATFIGNQTETSFVALFFFSIESEPWRRVCVQTGRLQQTLAGCVERSGKTLHSGKVSTVRLCPGFAGQGRYFDFRSNSIPASVEFVQVSPLCTSLCRDGFRIRTVEHLLSALEAAGVDNCRIEIENSDAQGNDNDAEVRLLNASWIDSVGE